MYLELSEHFCSSLPNLIWTKLLPKHWMNNSLWAASFTPPPLFSDPVTFSLPTGTLEVFFYSFLEGKYFFVDSLEMLFLQAEMDLWCAVNLQREGEVWKNAKYVFLLPTIIWGEEDGKSDFPPPDNLFSGNHKLKIFWHWRGAVKCSLVKSPEKIRSFH